MFECVELEFVLKLVFGEDEFFDFDFFCLIKFYRGKVFIEVVFLFYYMDIEIIIDVFVLLICFVVLVFIKLIVFLVF